MRLTIVAGARPNFMKIAPIIKAINTRRYEGADMTFRLVHTGQHFDKKMSGDFFDQLGIPEPDTNLEAGGGSQAEQTAAIMIGFERELRSNPCDMVIVVGDVTSTMACAIVAKKECIRVAHVEGGIRSGDMTMPEEINRLVTDSITDMFFTTSEQASANLMREGHQEDRIHFVGNTMIDTLLANRQRFCPPALYSQRGLTKGKYLVLTLHRPANVDDQEKLVALLTEVVSNTENRPVVFPVHPRTAKVLAETGWMHPQLIIAEPLPYLEFNYLVANSLGVITDSGGITEETTVMGIPCMTLRDSTERPETVALGTNELIGTDPSVIRHWLRKMLAGKWKKGSVPPLWDGHSAHRIVDLIGL